MALDGAARAKKLYSSILFRASLMAQGENLPLVSETSRARVRGKTAIPVRLAKNQLAEASGTASTTVPSSGAFSRSEWSAASVRNRLRSIAVS